MINVKSFTYSWKWIFQTEQMKIATEFLMTVSSQDCLVI